MPRLRHTVEQILAKWREAEVAIDGGEADDTSGVSVSHPVDLTIPSR